MKIKISKIDNRFVVDPISLAGSPPVGRGSTMMEALGDFLISHQVALGLEIEVDASAAVAEKTRREGALRER